jgi:hypothetical protein
MHRKQWDLKGLSGHFGKEKEPLSIAGNRTPNHSTPSLVARTTTLSRPRCDYRSSINVNGYKCDKSIGTVSRYDIKESPQAAQKRARLVEPLYDLLQPSAPLLYLENSIYRRTHIRINWDSEPCGYAENPDNCISL